MNSPYTPISCAVHDRLLAHATLGRECELTVEDDRGAIERLRAVIVDVYASGGAEYLRLTDGRTFRLDRLVEFNGDPVPPA